MLLGQPQTHSIYCTEGIGAERAENGRKNSELSGRTFDLVISLDARKITTFAVLLSKRAMLFFTTVSIAFRMITR